MKLRAGRCIFLCAHGPRVVFCGGKSTGDRCPPATGPWMLRWNPRLRSLGREEYGAMREEGDAHPASQISCHIRSATHLTPFSSIFTWPALLLPPHLQPLCQCSQLLIVYRCSISRCRPLRKHHPDLQPHNSWRPFLPLPTPAGPHQPTLLPFARHSCLLCCARVCLLSEKARRVS